MQVTIVTSTTLWDLTVHAHSMPSAFQFQEGVSNYSNPHITFNLNYNCLSQYLIYKKAFHTTTHQIDTSQQMEKSAAPGQRVSFTLSLENLQDRHVGARWFWEVVFWEIIQSRNSLTFMKLRFLDWRVHVWHSYHLHYDPWLSLAFSGVASISSTPAWVIRSAMFFSRSSMRVLISSSEAAVQEHNWHQSLQTTCAGHSHLFGALRIKFKSTTVDAVAKLKKLWKRHVRPFCADL